MANIPKPELEQGAYICYANEPNTIVDNAGGGGGGGGNVFFVANYDLNLEKYVPEFTYNQVKEAFLAGKALFVTSINEDDSSFEGHLMLVTQIVSTGDSYNVTLSNSTGFYSSDPDAIME